MEAEKKTWAVMMECGHCRNKAPMEVHASIFQHDEQGDGLDYREGSRSWHILECPNCKDVTLLHHPWHDVDEYPELVANEILYPVARSLPLGLPDSVAKSFMAALRVKPIDANAFGVLLRRVLECVCEDREAEGPYLANKLQFLAERQEIPEKLAKIAAGIKDLGNVGAHPSLGDLTESEVPILEDLTRAVLEYVYAAPELARRATASVQRLRNAKKRSQKTPGKRKAKKAGGE